MAENKDYVTTQLENGTVNINEEVITTIVAAALRDLEGVVTAKNDKKNIRVELGENSVAVDCGLVLLYGHSVVEIARSVQNAVTGAIESMTGIKVKRVDVNVTGISMTKN